MAEYWRHEHELRLFVDRNFSGVRFSYTYHHRNQPTIRITDLATGKLLFERHFHEQNGWTWGAHTINDINCVPLSDEETIRKVQEEMVQALGPSHSRSIELEYVYSVIERFKELSVAEQEEFLARLNLKRDTKRMEAGLKPL